VPLHQVLLPSGDMTPLALTRSRTAERLALAMKAGMVTLIHDGIRKERQGFTPYRQVRAVAMTSLIRSMCGRQHASASRVPPA